MRSEKFKEYTSYPSLWKREVARKERCVEFCIESLQFTLVVLVLVGCKTPQNTTVYIQNAP